MHHKQEGEPRSKPVIKLMGFLRFWNNKNLISREVLCWGASLLAERITAYMAPLNTSYWRGFYFSGGYMTDIVEAKKNLDKYSEELSRYQNLSRTGLSLEELLTIDRIIIRLKTKIDNLRSMLNA